LGLDIGRVASEAKVFSKRVQPFENQHEDAGVDLLGSLMVITILPPTLDGVVADAIAATHGAGAAAGQRLGRGGSLDRGVNVTSGHGNHPHARIPATPCP